MEVKQVREAHITEISVLEDPLAKRGWTITRLWLAIGISCVALGDVHSHLSPIARLGINSILYAILVVAGAGWCFAMEPVIKRYIHLAGLLTGLLSISWTWGFYSGDFLPDGAMLSGLAFIHVVIAAIFVRPISASIISAGQNWEVAFDGARARVGRGKDVKSMTLLVIAIYLLPFISTIN